MAVEKKRERGRERGRGREAARRRSPVQLRRVLSSARCGERHRHSQREEKPGAMAARFICEVAVARETRQRQCNSSVRWLWRERQTSPVQWQHGSSVECAAGAREKKPGAMHGSAIHLGGGARSRLREEEEEARCNGWQRDSSVRCAWRAIGTGTEKKPKPSAMAPRFI